MKGSIRLFRIIGINVYIHWSWFLVAVFEIQGRSRDYSSPLWNIAEYLSVFLLVLCHEFGHALACRQVGGEAQEIVLWPLGGVAYVNPPQRPGAMLWSIAAGPLVNVAFIFILKAIGMICRHYGWNLEYPEAFKFLKAVWLVNWGLLIFNMLPVYPLDGGQILRSLLWFWIGRAKSLLTVSILGFAGALGVGSLGVWLRLPWTTLIAVYMIFRSWSSFQQSRALLKLEKIPRNLRFHCPSCQASPLQGPFWGCPTCKTEFDVFDKNGICPGCGSTAGAVPCLDCGRVSPIQFWSR